MAVFSFSVGSLSVTLALPHLRIKPNGIYEYYRRIDPAVKVHLGLTQNFIRISLRTRDDGEAREGWKKLEAKYEAEWNAIKQTTGSSESLKARDLDRASTAILEACGLSPGDGLKNLWATDIFEDYLIPKYGRSAFEAARYGDPKTYRQETEEDVDARLKALLNPADFEAFRKLLSKEHETPPCPYLSEALDLYIRQRELKQADTHGLRNAISYVVKASDDLPLDSYTKQHANAARDLMRTKGLKTTSIRRLFNDINAVVNNAISEHGLKLENQFSGINIPNLGKDAEKREVYTPEQLKTLAIACRNLSDDRRFILSMLIDTGARLAEIVGLRVSDVHLSAQVPHISIREYDDRSLKTAPSTRTVPLVGEALWAAQMALEGKDGRGLLFPCYGPSKANSASAALNKWIKESICIPRVVHELRHTMKSRLLRAGVPEDVRNRIGGWSDGGNKVSRGYDHHDLRDLREHMLKVVSG